MWGPSAKGDHIKPIIVSNAYTFVERLKLPLGLGFSGPKVWNPARISFEFQSSETCMDQGFGLMVHYEFS